MIVGETFLNLNPSSDPHLWIIIAGPTSDGAVAMVNCTTKRLTTDDSCILKVGDHPFFDHDSGVNYRMGKVVQEALLENWRKQGILQMRRLMPPDVLLRIQQGALSSKYASNAIKDAVKITLGAH